MKVTIPENITEVTLEKYMKYDKLVERTELDEYNFKRRKIEIFTEIPFHQTKDIIQKDFEFIINKIDEMLLTGANFTPTFKVNKKEFGFIPNFDKITFEEHVLISNLGKQKDSYIELMAVLFRPIKDKDIFGNYTIEPYDEDNKHLEDIKLMPLHVYNGAIFFFLNLANELLNSTQKYMEEELQRV